MDIGAEQLEVVIQALDNKKGYIMTCEDRRELMVKNINEAIELKNKLIKGKE